MSDLNMTQGVGALKKKNYSVLSIVCLIYCSAAAGAFGVEEMLAGCGPGMTMIMLVFVALCWGMPDCYRMAELSSVMPEEGGLFYWTKKLFGEFWAFQAGWWVAISYYVCGSTYVVLSVDYLSTLMDLNNAQAICIKLAIIIVFTVINLMGLKEVSWLSIVFAVIILIAFAVITVVGFANWNYNPVDPIIPPGATVGESVSSGLAIGIWMYCGWAIITMIAGEVSNNNAISKALRITVPLIALSYILPALAGVAAVGHWDSWTVVGADGVGFSTVLEKYIGPGAVVAFVIVAIVGQLAIFNTNIAGGSRVFFVMADDGLFPRKFITNVSKKRGVPYVGILSISLVTILMMEMDFTALVLIQVIPVFACAVITSACFWKARKMMPVEERKAKGFFVVGGGKLGFWFCFLSPAIIGIVALYINGADYFIYGQIFLLSGVILYVLIKPICKGAALVDGKHFPENPKTKMAFGDIFKVANFTIVIGLTTLIGSPFLRWFEGSWGPEYYAYEYGSGFLANFDAMMNALLIGGAVITVIGIILRAVAAKIDKKTDMPVYEKGESFIDG